MEGASAESHRRQLFPWSVEEGSDDHIQLQRNYYKSGPMFYYRIEIPSFHNSINIITTRCASHS
jgi:hypothetical protein